MARGGLAVYLALCLLANALSAPSRPKRVQRGIDDNRTDSKESSNADHEKPVTTSTSIPLPTVHNITGSTTHFTNVSSHPIDSSSEEDDFDDKYNPAPSTGGGSNIISLLNLANAFFPASSGTTNRIKYEILDLISRIKAPFAIRRRDLGNKINVDYVKKAKPLSFIGQRQETESSDIESSESISESDEDDSEESNETESNENGDSNTKQSTESNAPNAIDDDELNYDEPPEGDGQGGGVFGLLAGLSGDGDSTLGNLLATVGGIIADLSGDGVDINAVIATSLGLLVGILSTDEVNPGELIASYLQTALNTISGGGSQNNGAFFGKFVSTLVKGISAAEQDSEEEGPPMSDSAGFFTSLLMGLLGDMSKSSFGGSSKPWR